MTGHQWILPRKISKIVILTPLGKKYLKALQIVRQFFFPKTLPKFNQNRREWIGFECGSCYHTPLGLPKALFRFPIRPLWDPCTTFWKSTIFALESPKMTYFQGKMPTKTTREVPKSTFFRRYHFRRTPRHLPTTFPTNFENFWKKVAQKKISPKKPFQKST